MNKPPIFLLPQAFPLLFPLSPAHLKHLDPRRAPNVRHFKKASLYKEPQQSNCRQVTNNIRPHHLQLPMVQTRATTSFSTAHFPPCYTYTHSCTCLQLSSLLSYYFVYRHHFILSISDYPLSPNKLSREVIIILT